MMRVQCEIGKKVVILVLKTLIDLRRTPCVVGVQNLKACAIIGEVGRNPQLMEMPLVIPEQKRIWQMVCISSSILSVNYIITMMHKIIVLK